MQTHGDLTVLKWRPSAILDLWNSKFLTVGAVKRPILRQRAKHRKDRSNRYGDIAIFVIFQDGGRRHFEFSKIRNFNDRSALWGQYASLYQISSKSVKRLQRYNDLTVFFSKWRPSAIFDLLGADWDHPRRVLVGLYRCAKFGWNRCISFDNIKLSIFCPFGLKTPIHAPKLGFWGYFNSKMGSNVYETPKGTSLPESASFEPSSAKIRRRVWPVGEFMKKRYK